MKNENKSSSNEDHVFEYQLNIAKSISESKARYRKIVQAAIARWVKDFQEGRIEIKTVDDLKKLVEIDIELQRYEHRKQ